MAIFNKSAKLFDKDIPPKCAYCLYGVKSREGNNVLCEKRGVVDLDFSCNKYVYSPLKRIPIKQLNIHGAFDDDDDEGTGEEVKLEEVSKK